MQKKSRSTRKTKLIRYTTVILPVIVRPKAYVRATAFKMARGLFKLTPLSRCWRCGTFSVFAKLENGHISYDVDEGIYRGGWQCTEIYECHRRSMMNMGGAYV